MSSLQDAIDDPEAVARDIAAVQQISAVPGLLRIICDYTGMGFAAVARVTDGDWTACAVHDAIGFGLDVGGRLPVETTLCSQARQLRQPIAFDHASQDSVYRDHHTPRIYGLESYVSVPIIRKDGSYFGNLCAIDPKPAEVANERTLAMFQLFSELISRQLESEERQQATAAALLSERATAEVREQFIAVLGHDLRNPLAAVRAASDVLVRHVHEPEGVRIGMRLRAITRRMTDLLEDVLDFARGRLGSGVDVALRDVPDLDRWLGDAVQELRDAHPDRVIAERPGIAHEVTCDPRRLQQLLSNLVGNALAYGAPDQPIVIATASDDQRMTLSVTNGGAPIPAENLAKVFQPYWRPANSQPGGGLGLGLYICAQIVKAHGGRLEVTSSAAAGTRFIATLPLRAV